ncbi:MAG: hypothetical protein M1127_01480, partial [Patescibacteria group bacterium]|nr:hypothetical protein [Patescibacteria group bacterium]
LWKSLNKNRGTLYTQLPLPNYDLMSVPRGSNAEDLLYFMGVVGKGREKIMVWINNLLGSKSEFETAISDNEGLPTIHNDYSVLRLRKTPGSPLQLPKLENLDKL